jgi:23S rRNA (cytosine1962-C5)-methyltransferase
MIRVIGVHDVAMPPRAPRAEAPDYELLDAGDGRRLERFGPRVADRPSPVATEPRRTPGAWAASDVRFEIGSGWAGPTEPWTVALHGLVIELRTTASGGLGLYPEHTTNLDWLAEQVRARCLDRQPSVLNLFAHTGLATLNAARAGALVAHVDAARNVVAWARHNAELSGLADRPIRWLVDDALEFVAREARRGRRYDGIVLDPPSFGRARGRRWRLAEELPRLLAACHDVATDDAFVLLSAHTTGLSGTDLRAVVSEAFQTRRTSASIEVQPLALEAASGARLELGWAARLVR